MILRYGYSRQLYLSNAVKDDILFGCCLSENVLKRDVTHGMAEHVYSGIAGKASVHRFAGRATVCHC